MRNALFLGVLFLCGLLQAREAEAERIQILHVNDLHSYLEPGETYRLDTKTGGYAALKSLIVRLKSEAAEKKMATLTLHAGDFLEGHSSYLVDEGRTTFEAFNELGFDAGVIGNHDWLMGVDALDRLLSKVKLKFEFLGANLVVDATKHKTLSKKLKPGAEFKVGGVKVGIVGLTTPSPFYSWALHPAELAKPTDVAPSIIEKLRAKNDLVLALSHLGIKDDRKFIRKTKGVDLIIGGHDHFLFEAPKEETDPDGNKVPIFQAGAHGEKLGRLILDVGKDRRYEIVSYEVIDVDPKGAKDPGLEKKIAKVRGKFLKLFGEDWLHQTIGSSEVALENGELKNTEWTKFVAQALRNQTGAAVGFDVGDFHGVSKGPGLINRGDLIAMYPRIFEFDGNGTPRGWNVWTLTVPRIMLAPILAALWLSGSKFHVDGLEFELPEESERLEQAESLSTLIKNVRVPGEGGPPEGKAERALYELKPFKLAFPEGVLKGLVETLQGMADQYAAHPRIAKLIRGLSKHPKDTGLPVWTALEQELGQVKTIRKR